MQHEVMVAKGKDGASYLTDAKGMALYTFKKDTPVKKHVRRGLRAGVAALPPGEGRSHR